MKKILLFLFTIASLGAFGQASVSAGQVEVSTPNPFFSTWRTLNHPFVVTSGDLDLDTTTALIGMATKYDLSLASGGDNMANADLTMDASYDVTMGGFTWTLASTNTTKPFAIEQPDGSDGFEFFTANTYSVLDMQGASGSTELSLNTLNDCYINGGSGLAIGATSTTARLLVKGSGAGSATTTALFENSSGTDALEILDNTKLLFGGTNNAGGLLNITGSAVDSYTDIQGYRTNGTTKTWGIEVDAVGYPFFKGYETNLNVGTAAHYIEFKSTHNRFEFWNGGAIPFSFDNNGIYPSYINTELIVNGPSASKEAALKVIGNGAGSATTTALFENSSGTASLTVLDDGSVYNYGANSTSNTAFGEGALVSNVSGISSVAIGKNAMGSSPSSYYSVAVGNNALNVATGDANVAIGASTLPVNIAGHSNVSIGYESLLVNVDGNTNVSIGRGSQKANVSGDGNVSIGNSCMQSVTASNNTGIGETCFRVLAGGTGNVGLGRQTAYSLVSGNYNIFLGHESGFYETGSNKLYIDNARRGSLANGKITSMIYGEFHATTTSQMLRFNANVEVKHDLTFGENANVLQNVKVTISSAQILALNTTPIEVVPAPPSGYAIRVISASGKMNFLTAAYATSTTIGLCTATATLCQLTSANLLGSATSIIQRISNEVTGVGTQLVDNQALTVTSLIADPTAGSGTLDLYITYELIKL